MPTLTANIQPVAEQISDVRDNYPHSIALSYGDRQLSYEELDRRADRFAGYLTRLAWRLAALWPSAWNGRSTGSSPLSALCALVLHMCPLDSAWPDSRLRFAVKDSGATVLVARAALLDRLQVKARGIDPCRDAAAIAAAPGAARRTVEPESLAYVIYTSGSTGVPKGVEITHANLAHLSSMAHRCLWRHAARSRESSCRSWV